jgi:lipopolysaccharide transport system ATP-binding protein
MEGEVLVQVEGLSKKFAKTLKKSLKYGAYDLVANLRGRKPSTTLRPEEFWALQDINFEVRRGECLGLIGHNGAGKSTLLKILNGLINPDQGKVTMRGRVGALIELGAGFNPIMSGRENIYNNGAVLGFSRTEIDRKVEEIIDFSEIREFIDMPVQNYSSGMKVRLGFAVAAQMEPDILIIDEVLAVGDVGFRAKCYEKIGQLIQNTAVILVSHSMHQIARITTKTLLLDKGREGFLGLTSEGTEQYYNQSKVKKNKIKTNDIITSFEIKDIEDDFISGDRMKFHIILESSCELENIDVNLVILSREEIPVAQMNSLSRDLLFKLKKGRNQIYIVTDHIKLNSGIYFLSITLFDYKNKRNIIWADKVSKFAFKSKYLGVSSYVPNADFKLIE